MRSKQGRGAPSGGGRGEEGEARRAGRAGETKSVRVECGQLTDPNRQLCYSPERSVCIMARYQPQATPRGARSAAFRLVWWMITPIM